LVPKGGVDPATWSRRIKPDPLPINANFASRCFTDDPFFRGNFTLHVRNTQNGTTDQVDGQVHLSPTATHAHKIRNLALSGRGDQPTFTRAPPAGATVNGNRGNIIDPEAAAGQGQAIGLGGPNFASVLLPTGIGDGLYDLWGFDDANQQVLLAADPAGGTMFNFGGVSRFRATGIEASAGLDPNSTTAFITGLTFTGHGQFTGTKTPITVTINDVPLPPTVALAVGGLALLGWRRRRVH
jgi:hypothetical protein